MKRNPRKQRLVSEINITPFTDVILVLLVIFMITTPLLTEAGLKVNLPQAKSGKPIEKAAAAEQAQSTITSEGPIYLDGSLVTKKELKEKVGMLYKDNPEIRIVLRSDRFVQFKNVVDVLDPLAELGITKLNIATTNEE